MYRPLLMLLIAGLALNSLLAGCGGHISSIERSSTGMVAERIYSNLGGNVASEHAKWKARQAEHGTHYYIIDGGCASFCAFVAMVDPKSCYTENARLSIHPASFMGVMETPQTREFTAHLVSLWPQGLQDWWASNRPTVLGADLLYSDLKRIIPERECKA